MLGIHGPKFTQADAPLQFAEKVVLQGVMPDATLGPSNFGNFAVCLEPIGSFQMGRAVVSGVVPCKVNLVDDSDAGDAGLYNRWCDITNADATQLTVCDGGGADPMERGTGSGTWCIVRLGNRQGGLFPVILIEDGGGMADYGECRATRIPCTA